MKRIYFLILLTTFALSTQAQQNTLLSADFWRGKPDLARVKAEIAKGNDPSESNAGSHDPVTMAINGDLPNDVVKFLVEQKGNSVDKKTHHSRHYLHWAAAKGNIELVNFLIAKGADVNYADSYGVPITAYAASGGSNKKEVFDALFAAGVNPKQTYADDANLIMLAIATDVDLTMTDYFISKGVVLTDKDEYGRTVADYALRLGNFDIVEALVKRGVKLTDQALFFATQGSRQSSNGLEVFKKLVEEFKLNPKVVNPSGATVLHALVRRPSLDIISYFIEKGVDVNKADRDGNTALIIAAAGQNKEIFETILAKTSNINASNEKGETALFKAFESGSLEIAQSIVDKGADLKAVDKEGNNVVIYWFGSYRAPRPGPQGGPGQGNPQSGPQGQGGSGTDAFEAKFNLLKSKDVAVAGAQKSGISLFHLAVERESTPMIEKAAQLGANINTQDKEEMTALHKAALKAKNDVILKLLISKGAKKDLKNEFDETAYDLAAANEFLKENNISIDFLK